MNTVILSIIRLYKYALRLYPSSFRKEFEGQMLLDFSDMAADAGRKGIFSLILFCLRELIDFPMHLLRVHFEEGPLFIILRSQPVNTGLRSGLGFGITFALSLPLTMLVSETVLYPIDSIVTSLSIFYYDHFHVEPGFELILWIPSAFSSLLTGLALGSSFAVLFADRSKYSRYILAGMLGWFLHDAMSDLFIVFFNTQIFLDGNQTGYFFYTVSAFSGAIFGLIFIVAKSEQPEAVELLTRWVFVYLLFAYLWVELLSDLFVFNTSWRFVCLLLLMLILVASVFAIAMKIDSNRKQIWVVIVGTVGNPVLTYVVYSISQLFSPPISPSGILSEGRPFFWLEIILSNGVYGILIGLLLGLVIGIQNKTYPPSVTP